MKASQSTTAPSLGALLQSACDIMRKDEGINGDLDRLLMLTWIMFLKFLGDLELQRESEATLSSKKFKPALLNRACKGELCDESTSPFNPNQNQL